LSEWEELPAATEETASQIVDAAFAVHSTLGPGLLESVYEGCMAVELESRGMGFERQLSVPLVYKGYDVGPGFRVDLLVEGCVLVELKSMEILLPLHAAQLLTYLRLTANRLSFLINFNVPQIRDGIQRYIL
jgi:GxxExxY protein